MNAFAVPLTPWGVAMSVCLAVSYGLIVSIYASRHARTGLVLRQQSGALAGAEDLAGQLGADSTALHAWHLLIDASASSLANLRVRLTHTGVHEVPVVARRTFGPDRPDPDAATVVIPRGGAVVRFSDPRMGLEILVTPVDGFGAVEVSRVMLLAFAEQVETFARVGLLAGL